MVQTGKKTSTRDPVPVVSLNEQSALSGGLVAGGIGQYVAIFLLDKFPEIGAMAPALGAVASAGLIGLGTWARNKGGLFGKIAGWFG